MALVLERDLEAQELSFLDFLLAFGVGFGMASTRGPSPHHCPSYCSVYIAVQYIHAWRIPRMLASRSTFE